MVESLTPQDASLLQDADIAPNAFSTLLLGQTRVLEMVMEGEPLLEVLDAIVALIENVQPGAIASILLLDTQGRLVHGAARQLPERYLDVVNGVTTGLGVGACGEAAFTGKRVVVEDIATHPNWDAYREVALTCGLAACWSEPIVSRGGRVLGTFAQYYRTSRGPTEAELRLQSFMANLARVAIERSRTESALRRSEERLELLQDITSRHDLSFENKVKCLLALGCEQLDMDTGCLAEVVDGQFRACCVRSGEASSISCSLSETYCGETLARDSGFSFTDLATADTGHGELREGVRAYLGVPVYCADACYGTLSFTSRAPRPEPFSVAEREFLRLMAQWVGAELTRQSSEKALRRREREFRTLVENTPDIIARFDIEGRHTFINRAVEGMTGLLPEAFIGKTPEEAGVPPELAAQWRTAAGEAITSRQVQGIRFAFATPTGTRIFQGVVVPELGQDGEVTSVLTVTRDITDAERGFEAQTRLTAVLAEAEQKQRRFIREVLFNVSGGRLRLCDSEEDLPAPVADPNAEPIALDSPASLSEFRQTVARACERIPGPKTDVSFNLLMAAGEAAMNAVVHATGGEAVALADPEGALLQVWVRDTGGGIGDETLHRATLERGFSSAGSLGQGFWMMLQTCERVYLLTGAAGTTVVLEQPLQPKS